MKRYLLYLFTLFFFASCMEQSGVRSRYVSGDNDLNNGGGTTGATNSGNGANPGNGGITVPTEEINPQVEIRHLIEPKIDSDSNTGAYVRKLTIPKNYEGFLYVAGLNVSSLSQNIVKVRFRFGWNRDPIDIEATVTTAPGLTPQTNTEVLVLNFLNAPFRDLTLPYSLYDYNDYDYSGDDENKPSTPTQYNRDAGLFCRGLRLQDDPTFTGNLANGCTGPNDVCKYAYASVLDKGLTNDLTSVAMRPTTIQVETGNSSGYYTDNEAIMLNRCLPDKSGSFKFSETKTMAYLGVQNINGVNYRYEGPFLANNLAGWEIAGSALTNTYGLFTGYLDSGNVNTGYGSKLFPLFTQRQLPQGVEHLGSIRPDDTKVITQLNSSGPSDWMDGCNARVGTVAPVTGENIGSCNVTSSLEIIALQEDGTEKVVDKTIEVKLQVVKPSVLNTDGEDVLSGSFQSCTSSSQCGTGSCCFNKRCWSKSIVSQCAEESQGVGNLPTGQACGSDLECSSLCCNPGTGRCGVHDTESTPAVTCSKPFGQKCIAKEWCQKETVTQCFIVKTGFDSQNQTTCALRCFTTQEHGDCMNGTCVAGPKPDIPVFNPNDPNRCDSAYDPSELPINIQSN